MKLAEQFLKSKWYKMAKVYARHPEKLKGLLLPLGYYLSKEGLSGVRENITLMYNYIQDIASGRYKDYNIQKLIIIIAALIYVVSPFDFFPDMIPGGLIDDASIIAWALKQTVDELKRYKINNEQDTALEQQ